MLIKSDMRQWHLVPAKKDGRPVPVVVRVEVHYERDKDGNVMVSSQQPTLTQEVPKQSSVCWRYQVLSFIEGS
jgi:hypothetical protein